MDQVARGVSLSLTEMVTARNLGRAKLDEEGMNQVAGGASGAQLRPLPWNRLNIVQNHAFWNLSDVILELLENFGLGAPWTCNAVLKLDGEKINQVAPDRCPATANLDKEKLKQVAGSSFGQIWLSFSQSKLRVEAPKLEIAACSKHIGFVY